MSKYAECNPKCTAAFRCSKISNTCVACSADCGLNMFKKFTTWCLEECKEYMMRKRSAETTEQTTTSETTSEQTTTSLATANHDVSLLAALSVVGVALVICLLILLILCLRRRLSPYQSKLRSLLKCAVPCGRPTDDVEGNPTSSPNTAMDGPSSDESLIQPDEDKEADLQLLPEDKLASKGPPKEVDQRTPPADTSSNKECDTAGNLMQPQSGTESTDYNLRSGLEGCKPVANHKPTQTESSTALQAAYYNTPSQIPPCDKGQTVYIE